MALNQEIRDAVEKIIDQCPAQQYGFSREYMRNVAKRLYPLSKPREIRVGLEKFRVTEGTLRRWDEGVQHWGTSLATPTALKAYDQLKALGFTEEE